MEITGPEALDLLRKWHDEESMVDCCVVANADGRFFEIGAVCGRLTHLSTGAVRISSNICGPPEMQAATYLEIPLLNSSYQYHEPEPDSGCETDRLFECSLRIGPVRSCVVYELSLLPQEAFTKGEQW